MTSVMIGIIATVSVLSFGFAIGYINYDRRQRRKEQLGEGHVDDVTRVEILCKDQDVFEKAVTDGLIAVGTVVPDVGKGKHRDASNDEIPMKGKRCSENDIKYNRVAPKRNNPPRR